MQESRGLSASRADEPYLVRVVAVERGQPMGSDDGSAALPGEAHDSGIAAARTADVTRRRASRRRDEFFVDIALSKPSALRMGQ